MSQFFNYDTDKMLACSCCGVKGMKPSFLMLLDQIRKDLGEPMIITSGYRCSAHNRAVSSTGDNGPHVQGQAVDVKASSDLRFRLVAVAMKHGINRIGIAKSFVHLDDLSADEGFPEKRIWTYG